MNDHELAANLRAIHLDRGVAPGADAVRRPVLEIPIDGIPQHRAWGWPIAEGRHAWTAAAMRLAAAGFVLVTIGGLVVAGPLAPQRDHDRIGTVVEGEPSASPTALSSASASLPPSIAPTEGDAIVWDSTYVTLAADSFEARTGDHVFTADRPVWVESSYNGIWLAECPDRLQALDGCLWWMTTEPDPDPFTSLILQVRWFEEGFGHHLWMLLLADEAEWFAQEVTYRRGTRDDRQWDEFQWDGPLFTTPLARPFRGDVVLSEPDRVGGVHRREARRRHDLPRGRRRTATLAFEDLVIEAYRPHTLPAVRTDCQPLRSRGPDPNPVNRDFFAVGEPLHGHEDILEMTPAEAESLLDELGYCYGFSYRVRWDDWEPASDAEREFGRGGAYELWCSAPPHGRIRRIGEGAVRVPDHPYHAGAISVQVIDDTPRPRRDQPPVGFDCPTMADAAAGTSP